MYRATLRATNSSIRGCGELCFLFFAQTALLTSVMTGCDSTQHSDADAGNLPVIDSADAIDRYCDCQDIGTVDSGTDTRIKTEENHNASNTETRSGDNEIKPVCDINSVTLGTVPDTLCGLTTIGIDIAEFLFDELVTKTDEEIAVEVPVRASIGGEYYDGVTMELHGGLARTYRKKSFRLTFDADNPARITFFDSTVEYHRRLVLQASWIDSSFLRNKLTMDLVRVHEGLAPRIGHAMLYINQKLYGLFTVIERIDNVFFNRQGYNDGDTFNLFKAVGHKANWADKPNPLDGYEVKINQDNPTDDLGVLLRALSEVPLEKDAFVSAVEPLLNLDQFMIWQMVHTYAMDRDSFTKNYYLYHDLSAAEGTDDAQFRIVSWDADATWGNDWDGTNLEPNDEHWHGHDTFSSRLFAIDHYRKQYLDSYGYSLNHSMTTDVLLEQIKELTATIKKAAELDSVIWERDDKFEEEIERLRDAVVTRNTIMQSVVSESAK
jgi:spore coat protein H